MAAYTGWLLPQDERARLLDLITPAYPDVVAHHVTLSFGVPADTPAPENAMGEVVGIVDDGAGVQALVVRVNGTTQRPDGSTFHITWSLDKAAGRKAVHSNAVIRAMGWQKLVEYVVIRLEGRTFR